MRAVSQFVAKGMILLMACAVAGRVSSGQEGAPASQEPSPLAFDSLTTPARAFIAAHGRQALVDGFASGGLEVWAYPFQILSDYRVEFREQGTTTAIAAQDILARVVYEPDSVTRIYMGPDFMVREKLLTPLDLPGAMITYSVESRNPIQIEVHATPVLDLMWPGALGGQSTAWNSALSAFVLTEPADGYSATVGSAEVLAHDETDNRTVREAGSSDLGFTLQPDKAGNARVFIALNPPHAANPGALFQKLMTEHIILEEARAAHTRDLQATALKVETPDQEINQAIAWSEIALDDAWVCNPELGCGFVAGYGPSRGARRPQYDWFFSGDGMVAAEGSIAAGEYARARDELAFIFRYQDRKTGMIWHELSQSAGLIDWAGKFPYMFVHVDITFQFLSAIERYVTASGDAAFVRAQWESIASAYGYCRSLIDPETGLPRIPADKEGGDEQDRIADDLGLSTSWVQAAGAFAHLAALAGKPALAEEATKASQLAARNIPARYWSKEQAFWVSGHTPSGQNEPERRSSPAEAIGMQLFSPAQNEALLRALASSSFQTDWGTRSVAAGSPGYDSGSYAKGSVWAVGTAELAEAFWAQHQPVTALEIWRGLLPWTRLDSLGHMHEVLHGDVYRAQSESVPEQTWSSAGFLHAAIHGLLGLDVDSISNRITFAPHLPGDWRTISVKNIHLSNVSLSLAMERTPQGLTLTIDNPGPDCSLVFSPELPLGAHLGAANFRSQPLDVKVEQYAQETDARVELIVPHGSSQLHLAMQGGVSILPQLTPPILGEESTGIRMIETNLAGNSLTLEVDVRSDRVSRIQMETAWEVASVKGATLAPAGDGVFMLTIPRGNEKPAKEAYRRAVVTVTFKP